MTLRHIRQILKNTDFIHTGGSAEELKVAEYLKSEAEAMGAKAWLEPFPVQMADVKEANLIVDGREIPCKGYKNCGSGTVEAPLVYIPAQDYITLKAVRGKIVLIDGGLRHFGYHDMLEAGAVGFITYDGNLNFPNRDIDAKELRSFVADGKKTLAVNINAKDAQKIVLSRAKTAKITVEEDEYEGESRNVVAEIPGTSDEWIVLSAHYDSTALSHGSYDNMTGCVGLLGVLEAMKSKKRRYGLRFVFCGSEERGLLGSKAYVKDHEEELEKVALNINLDMIGTIMGKFIAKVSAEDKLAHYLSYLGAELGFPVDAKTGVYSSDSTPFADKGVPALSLARLANGSVAPIHCRYDRPDVLSMEQMQKDVAFIAEFTRRMADAAVCPVSREIPEKVKKELDEYLFRKRKGE